ncbi:MAG: STAS domain-containing protein [Planctomycetes bacterium]|nr:STAS domain-containing protein [Planctomycetota bacterium]
MEMETIKDPSGVTVVVFGRLIDDATAHFVEDELLTLLDISTGPVVLDMGRLEYTNSAGLRAVLRFSTRARQQGRKFCMAGLSGFALDIFQTSGLDRIMMIVPDRDQAIKALTIG